MLFVKTFSSLWQINEVFSCNVNLFYNLKINVFILHILSGFNKQREYENH